MTLTLLCQMIIFAAQNVLSRTHSELGYLLLHCIRRYVDLDIYAALEVHTEDTIAAGRDALSQFSILMDVGSMSRDMQYFWLMILTNRSYILKNHNLKPTRVGISQRNICSCICLTTSLRKVSREIITQSQMKKCTAH